MNTVRPEKIRSMQQLFNSLIADKTRDNLPKYALLAGAGCSVPSGVVSGKRIIDIIQKYTYLLQSNDSDNELLAKWNHQTQTLETFITEVESSIDCDKLQSYIASKQKSFREEMEKPDFCLKLINTLPNSLKCDPSNGFVTGDGSLVKKTDFPIDNLENASIWKKYCNFFEEELQYGFWMYEYSPISDDIQNLIEDFIEYKNPSAEYYLLADLVAKGVLYNIFTTNFDDFFQEALSFLGLRARVCAFEDKANYIHYDREKPNIIKLHGDYLYNNTRNYNNETTELHESLKSKFQEALGKFGIIVVGYAGNDYSIMSVLEELKQTISYPLYWCIIDYDLQKGKIPWRVRELVCNTKNSFFVPIPGFTEFVELLWRQWHQVEKIGMSDSEDGSKSISKSFIIGAFDKAAKLSEQLKKILNSPKFSEPLTNGIPLDTLIYDFSRMSRAPIVSPFALYDTEIVVVSRSKSVYLPEAVKFFADMDAEKRELARHIIKLVGDFTFLTTRNITLLLGEKGITISQEKVHRVLCQLTSMSILTCYTFQTATAESNFFTYSLAFNGDKLYKQLFKVKPQWTSTLELTTASGIKKHLVAAQIISSMQKYIGNISYQVAPKLGSGSGGVRPTLMFQYAKDNCKHQYLFEIVRKEPNWENDLLEKLHRYNKYITRFDNTTLIICGENKEHLVSLFQASVSWGKIARDKMLNNQLGERRIWFAEDIAFLSERLKNTYMQIYDDEQGIWVVPVNVESYFNIMDFDTDFNIEAFDGAKTNSNINDKNIPSGYVCREESDESAGAAPQITDDKLRSKIIKSCLAIASVGEPIYLSAFAIELQKNDINYHEYGFSKLIELLKSQNSYLSIEGIGTVKYVKLLESQLTNDEVALAQQLTDKSMQRQNSSTKSGDATSLVSTLLHDIYLGHIPTTLKVLEMMLGNRVSLADLAQNYQLYCADNVEQTLTTSLDFYTGFQHPQKGKIYMHCVPNERLQPWKYKNFYYNSNTQALI